MILGNEQDFVQKAQKLCVYIYLLKIELFNYIK